MEHTAKVSAFPTFNVNEPTVSNSAPLVKIGKKVDK